MTLGGLGLATPLAIVVGIVLGYLLAHALGFHRRALAHVEELRQRERDEGDKALARLRQELLETEERAQKQAAVFQTLPEILREMFSSRGRRGVGPLALDLVEKLLRPEQVALFVARPARRRLALVAGRGLPSSVLLGAEVEYGSGRLGYVAEHRTPMDEEDFRRAPGERSQIAATKRQLEGSGLKGLRADIVVALEADGVLQGLLTTAGVRAHHGHGHDKRILEMVAGLTAVALTQVTRLKAAEEANDTDGLTGLYTWSHFEKRLAEETLKAERDKASLGLVLFDIDHFTAYNERNGHIEGDALLKRLAGVLKDSIREEDMAGRYGGEEFAVLFLGADKATTLGLAEDMRHAIEQFPFAGRELQPLGAVTVSGGVAAFPEDSKAAPELVRRAEEAVYAAKGSGRNRVALAE